MRCFRLLGLGLLTASFALTAAGPARAAVVEKIVAVVGDEAILQSELRTRATPLLRSVAKQVPAGPQRTAAESQVLKDLLGRMVEELLEAQAADRLKISVSAEELDRALENVAAQQRVTVEELLANTDERIGLTEVEYRGEIRRQVLEGKLLSQRIRGRVRIGDEDLKNAYTRTLREERERREYRPSWIVLKLPADATPADIAERDAEAARIHAELKAGKSFAELAKARSEDDKSKDRGGDMGIHAPQKTQAAQSGKRPALASELEDRLLAMEPGQFTEPFHYQDAILILALQSRQPSKYKSFEAAKDEMAARVQGEILAREKTNWLEELKKRTHVETRL